MKAVSRQEFEAACKAKGVSEIGRTFWPKLESDVRLLNCSKEGVKMWCGWMKLLAQLQKKKRSQKEAA